MKIVALYNSSGDPGAYLEYPNLFNLGGEWIGIVTAKRDVYSVLGFYVGYLSDDRRILRPRTLTSTKERLTMPPTPPRARFVPPATVPLAPLMSELTHSVVDVLIERPELLHTLDVGELREDID